MDEYPIALSLFKAIMMREPERQPSTTLSADLVGLGNPYKAAKSSSLLLNASSNSGTTNQSEKKPLWGIIHNIVALYLKKMERTGDENTANDPSVRGHLFSATNV